MSRRRADGIEVWIKGGLTGSTPPLAASDILERTWDVARQKSGRNWDEEEGRSRVWKGKYEEGRGIG